MAVGRVNEASAYLVATHAITITDIRIKEDLCTLSKRLCDLRPSSFLTSSSLVVILGQGHVSIFRRQRINGSLGWH